MTFGEKLNQIRTKRKISQADLAAHIGVSRATISRYESGERTRIAAPTIHAIADALGVQYSELLSTCDNVDFSYENLHDATFMPYGDMQLEELLFTAEKLNDDGVKEALRYVKLLLEIPRFKRDFEKEMEAQIESEWGDE